MFQSESRTRRRRGFTLIELLVVMAIIATLASMISAAIFKALEVSKVTDSINNLNNLGTAVLLYHSDYNYMPNETVQQKGGKGAGKQGSFYTAILDYVDQGNNDPQNPKPVRLFVNPGRRVPAQTAWRDYGYVGSQALSQTEGGLAAVLDDKNPVILSQMTNGVSNTALLSTLWMDPKQYNSDTKTWAEFPNSASKAENIQDRDQGGDQSIGAPHPGTNPHLFCDKHVGKVPYRWDPQMYPRMWAYNNSTVQVTLP